MSNMPLITRWNIHILPEWGDNSKEPHYAKLLVEYMDHSDVGDRINFVPENEEKPEYTFSITGNVYGRGDLANGDKVENGDCIATSTVCAFERLEDDSFGDTYAVYTMNTVYCVHGRDAVGLLRIKAGR